MAASERKSGLFITKGLHALRIVFMMGHADSDMYDGLFRTCRTGRDWVLTTAKMVCVKLELSTEQLFAKTWKCQIPAAKRALTIRGRPRTGFTTVLSVYGYNGAHFIKKPDGYGSTWFASQRTESAAVNSLVSFMQRYGHYVNELWLGSYGFDQPHFMLTLLQRAASGLSNVATITMQECACILPPPSQLPSLQQLSTETLASDDNWAYGNMEHEFRSSIAAVLPQLTTLSAYTDDCDDGPVLAAVVRRSGALCAHLTELVAPRVDDSLVCALIDHCPNLRRLETYSLNVSQQHKGRVWGVQALAVYSSYYNADVYNEADAFPYDLTRLARLPRLAAGSGQRLRMVAPETIEAWRPSKGRLILTVEDATVRLRCTLSASCVTTYPGLMLPRAHAALIDASCMIPRSSRSGCVLCPVWIGLPYVLHVRWCTPDSGRQRNGNVGFSHLCVCVCVCLCVCLR